MLDEWDETLEDVTLVVAVVVLVALVADVTWIGLIVTRDRRIVLEATLVNRDVEVVTALGLPVDAFGSVVAALDDGIIVLVADPGRTVAVLIMVLLTLFVDAALEDCDV